MYGLSGSVDLTFLIGRTITQVAVGMHQVQLHFDDYVSVSTECSFTLGASSYVPGAAGGGACGDVVACVWASARDKIGAPASPKKKWRRFMVANSLSLRMSGNIYFRLNSWYDKT